MNKFSLISTMFVLADCKDEIVIKSIPEKIWNISVLKVQTVKRPLNYKSRVSIVSEQQIDVISRATGFIQNFLVLKGDFVFKNQLLIPLDSSDIKGFIEQAKAAVNSAKLTVPDVDVEWYKNIFKSGSISENIMRKTQSFRDRIKDSLIKAETLLSTAKSQHKYIQILSKINRLVVEKHLKKRDLATSGKPILTIESCQELFLILTVAETKISTIYKGTKIGAFMDALNQKVEGVIAKIDFA